MNKLPETNQCQKCKQWFHTVHVCASDVNLMPVGCTTPSDCKQHGCHGACLPDAQAAQPAPTVPDQMQDWKGMDGTTAWHLIERHADNWADVGKMMGEWLAANQTAQPAHAHAIDTSPERVEKQAADVQVLEGWKLVPVEPTEAMVEAAGLDCVMGKSTWAVTAALWSAMLSAAPSTKEQTE